jgi:CBS domain-containing protein
MPLGRHAAILHLQASTDRRRSEIMSVGTPYEPRIANLRVADAMHVGVLTCDRDTPLADVAATMARELVHCVVVEGDHDGSGALWGIVSDLDLVAAAVVRNLDEQTAGGSAASPLVMIAPDETLQRAAQLMTEHGTSHLVVVDTQALRPVGVISTLDVAARLADSV